MERVARFLSNNLNLNFVNLNFSSTAWKAGAIVILLFLLVLSLAQVRRHFIDWSIKGALFGIFFGFLLALILEGFLLVGGRTALTEVLGWKDAPKPLQVALDAGHTKLVQVLGITDQVPDAQAQKNLTSDDAIEILQSLDPVEINKIKSLICAP